MCFGSEENGFSRFFFAFSPSCNFWYLNYLARLCVIIVLQLPQLLVFPFFLHLSYLTPFLPFISPIFLLFTFPFSFLWRSPYALNFGRPSSTFSPLISSCLFFFLVAT